MELKISHRHYFFGILLLAIFLRIVKFETFSMFGHDSSRDVILTYKMFTLGEIIYRGPVFSVIWGNLSPLYYYLIAPFHYLFNFHPLSSAIAANFLNILSVGFAVFTSYKFYGKKTAVIAGILFACSALIITNAGSALNPSMTPVFAVGAYYFLAKFLIDDQKKEPLSVVKKFPILDKVKYASLVGFSICISFVLALHPSGVFFVPFILIVFAFKRPKADIWSILFALGFFIALFVLPYLIQEKKMAWWTVNQIIQYFQSRESSGYTFYEKLVFFGDSVLRNTSLLMFGNVVKGYAFYTLPIYLFLVVDFVKSLIRFKQINHRQLLAMSLFLYLLTFVLLVPVEEGDFKRQWFGASYIPLIAIYLGIVLAQFAQRKYLCIGYFVLTILLLLNLKFIYDYNGSSDSYFHKKEIAEFLRTETNGSDFDVYGENPEPVYYVLWYAENDPDLKEEYRSWFVWAKGRKSDVMYLISADPDNSNSIKRYSVKEEVYTSSLGYKIVKFIK